MGRNSGGGGRVGAGRGTQLSIQQQLALRGDLGRYSDRIDNLNIRANRAQTAFERTYNVARTTPTQRERLLSKWQSAQADLRKEYNASLRFSRKYGLVKLPIPTGLEQRGSR